MKYFITLLTIFLFMQNVYAENTNNFCEIVTWCKIEYSKLDEVKVTKTTTWKDVYDMLKNSLDKKLKDKNKIYKSLSKLELKFLSIINSKNFNNLSKNNKNIYIWSYYALLSLKETYKNEIDQSYKTQNATNQTWSVNYTKIDTSSIPTTWWAWFDVTDSVVSNDSDRVNEINSSKYLQQSYFYNWVMSTAWYSWRQSSVDQFNKTYDKLSKWIIKWINDAVNPETWKTVYQETIDDYNLAVYNWKEWWLYNFDKTKLDYWVQDAWESLHKPIWWNWKNNPQFTDTTSSWFIKLWYTYNTTTKKVEYSNDNNFYYDKLKYFEQE